MSNPRLAWWACSLLTVACGGAGVPTVGAIPRSKADPSAPRCDLEQLDTLAQTLRSDAPRARRDRVAQGLRDACSTPASFDDFFASTGAPPWARAELGDESLESVRSICPSWNDVVAATKAVRPEEASLLVYERCDLAEQGLVEPQEWSHGQPSSLVPFVAATWLRAQGASSQTSKTIARAMVLGDRRTWALPEQSIATVEDPLPPVPNGPVVHITSDAVFANGERLVELTQGVLPSDFHEPEPFDGPLAKLARIDERATVVVVADATAKAHVLTAVATRLDTAGFEQIALVAEHHPLEFGAEILRVVAIAENMHAGISVAGYAFSHGERPSSLAPTFPEGAPPDFMGLAALIDGRIAAGDAPRVSFSYQSHDTTDIETFLRALSTLRATVCARDEQACADLQVSLVSTRSVAPRDPKGETTPLVRQGALQVSRGLDADIVRRIVRAHINEIRHCYNNVLKEDPSYEDVVTATFTIEASGEVDTSSATSREAHEGLAACVAKATRRWRFPRPFKGGTVEVILPFSLSPGSE